MVMFWGMLVVIIILGIIKMFIEFPGLLKLKLMYGVEVVEEGRDEQIGHCDVDSEAEGVAGNIIENINVLENILKTDIDEENNSETVCDTSVISRRISEDGVDYLTVKISEDIEGSEHSWEALKHGDNKKDDKPMIEHMGRQN